MKLRSIVIITASIFASVIIAGSTTLTGFNIESIKCFLRISTIFIVISSALYLNKIQRNVFTLCFSAVYTMVSISGRIYSLYNTLLPMLSVWEMGIIICKGAAYFLFYAALYSWFKVFIGSLKTNVIRENSYKLTENRLTSYALCCACYSMWFVLLRPNIATYDSCNQISQAFGWIPLANNNPFVHTLMMRLVLKSAFAITKNVLSAIAVYTAFSILVFSGITTAAVVFIENNFNKKNIGVRLLELFYFINPLVGWYSVTLWKDVWISYSTLLLVISLYLFENKKEKRIRYNITLFLAFQMVLFSKGTGILYVCALLFFYSFGKTDRKKEILIIIALSLVVNLGIVKIANNYCGVEKHNTADTESIIWQTIARTSKGHYDDFTPDELYRLNKFIDIEKAGQLYDFTISDPVKGTCLHYDYFEKHRKECLLTWIKLGCKYPGTYLNAIYGAGFGYYYPEIRYWVFATSNYAVEAIKWRLKDPYVGSYDIEKAKMRQKKADEKRLFLDSIRTWPVVGEYASIGFYFMIYFMLCIYGIEKKIKKNKLLVAVPLAVFLGCIMSPVFAEMRYAYPVIITIPIYITLYAMESAKTETRSSYGERN